MVFCLQEQIEYATIVTGTNSIRTNLFIKTALKAKKERQAPLLLLKYDGS